MIIEIKIPSPGESITEVEIANWLVNDGTYVKKDQEIAEIESDKATLPLLAEENGVISIKAETGTPIAVGSVACTIDTTGKPNDDENVIGDPRNDAEETKDAIKSKSAGNKAEVNNQSEIKKHDVQGNVDIENGKRKHLPDDRSDPGNLVITPLAKKLMEEEGLSAGEVIEGLKRITRRDIEVVAKIKNQGLLTDLVPDSAGTGRGREINRQRMSMLRRKLSERLVRVKNETAMLTTFNEVDMSNIIRIRKNYQSEFIDKHGVKLGLMSFFVKAVTVALKSYPNVNSYIEGEDIVTPGYYDIGIAVQTDKGLMVPVIRNVEAMSLAGIEKTISEIAGKARKNRISVMEMSGGTFTITNGGIFGSLLSTPILNPPQSGILGMHNIVDRPVAVDGKVEIRPMMFIALSYDHRIIDGRDSVGFLVRTKELLENPVKMLLDGKNPEDFMLDL